MGEYTVQNYDRSGSWTPSFTYNEKTNGQKPKTKNINGIEYVQTGDGKIGNSEFKAALIDYYQETYGAVGSPDATSLFLQEEYQKFQDVVNNFNLGEEINIDNDEDFVALLTAKTKELRQQIIAQNEANDDTNEKKNKPSIEL